MSKPLKMGDFFGSVHESYDEIDTAHIDNGKELYTAIAKLTVSIRMSFRKINI